MSVSVLETQKSLVLVEKGSGDSEDVELIRAAAAFRLVATMNPGGDFGKKEVNKEIKECLFVKIIRAFRLLNLESHFRNIFGPLHK